MRLTVCNALIFCSHVLQTSEMTLIDIYLLNFYRCPIALNYSFITFVACYHFLPLYLLTYLLIRNTYVATCR